MVITFLRIMHPFVEYETRQRRDSMRDPGRVLKIVNDPGGEGYYDPGVGGKD